MNEPLAAGIVVLAGLYFCVLAAVALIVPSRANRFLLGFANSQRVHFIELFTRLVVGGAFVIHAPRMFVPGVFMLFGWVLVITTACLLLLPWQWHHRFAQHAVPRATRYIVFIGIFSLAFGLFILMAVIHGNTA
jgi:hypothetical protein